VAGIGEGGGGGLRGWDRLNSTSSPSFSTPSHKLTQRGQGHERLTINNENKTSPPYLRRSTPAPRFVLRTFIVHFFGPKLQ